MVESVDTAALEAAVRWDMSVRIRPRAPLFLPYQRRLRNTREAVGMHRFLDDLEQRLEIARAEQAEIYARSRPTCCAATIAAHQRSMEDSS